MTGGLTQEHGFQNVTAEPQRTNGQVRYTKLELPDYPQVKGIFVGGCIERGEGSSFRRKAHAHNHRTDAWFGWICVRSWRRIGSFENGKVIKPSMLLLHEIAHIHCPNHGHDDKWRAEVRRLGGKLNYWEKKGWRKAHQHRWTKGIEFGQTANGDKWRKDVNELGEARWMFLN